MRRADIEFNSLETKVSGELHLDQSGLISVELPDPFFQHLLETLAFYAGFSLSIKADYLRFGDRHHLIEDATLALGRAILAARQKGKAVRRFGFFILPMDEALVTVALDLSGRAMFCLSGVQDSLLSNELNFLEDFGWSLVRSLQATLHFRLEYGKSGHHISEAFFKALGLCLAQALKENENGQIFSTKGTL